MLWTYHADRALRERSDVWVSTSPGVGFSARHFFSFSQRYFLNPFLSSTVTYSRANKQNNRLVCEERNASSRVFVLLPRFLRSHTLPSPNRRRHKGDVTADGANGSAEGAEGAERPFPTHLTEQDDTRLDVPLWKPAGWTQDTAGESRAHRHVGRLTAPLETVFKQADDY